MTGAMESATRSAVVERFAPIATLASTSAATATTQAPMSHDDLNAPFMMISAVVWIGRDVLERLQAHGTVRVPAPASEAS